MPQDALQRKDAPALHHVVAGEGVQKDVRALLRSPISVSTTAPEAALASRPRHSSCRLQPLGLQNPADLPLSAQRPDDAGDHPSRGGGAVVLAGIGLQEVPHRTLKALGQCRLLPVVTQ